ncbi:MAG: exosortase/archaeosortase family protein, partial [Rhodoferax sp.]|nr:exosortase/archaeosortase family protein [Rhodoferax sp.]
YWRLFPTLALLFLMIPSGDVLQPALRFLTVNSIEQFAVIANLPHSINGFSILIGENRYFVADACSGLSYVTLTIFFGYCFGLLLYRSVFKIAALTLLGAFLGIVSNVLRVNAIVLIDWVRGSQMDLTSHGTIQWMTLFIALALLFYVLNQLEGDATPVTPANITTEQPTPARRFFPLLAGLSVLLIAGIAAWVPTDASRPPHEAQTVLLPQNILGWELATPTPVWSIEQQSSTESLTLIYRRNGQEMRVMVIETLTPNAKLPESRFALGDKDIWHDVRVQKQRSCDDSNCLTFWHTTWERGKKQALRHVYYNYSIGSFSTDSKFALRAVHGLHRLTASNSSPRLIAFILDGAVPPGDDLVEAYRLIQSALGTSRTAAMADTSLTVMR